MEVQIVKFLKTHMWGKKGEVTEVSMDQAKRLIANGYAVAVEPKSAKRLKTDEFSNKSLSAR